MDNCSYIVNFVAVGINKWLHDGRGHSFPVDHCRHRDSGSAYSGTKNIVVIRSLAGEDKVFVKDGRSCSGKD